jgi:hypothetical protein
MSERLDPFANLKDTPVFAVKPRSDKSVEEKAISQIAEENNFPSRQAKKQPKIEKRKPRIHRTGRNIQLNSKVTRETFDRIYKLADAFCNSSACNDVAYTDLSLRSNVQGTRNVVSTLQPERYRS